MQPSTISKHLYAAIKSGNDGSGLGYGNLEKNSVSPFLKSMILEKNNPITINPKILAYYLLIKHPEFIKAGDSLDNVLTLFTQACNNSQDEISLRLLGDAYKIVEQRELATKYPEHVELISKIDEIIAGKIKLSSTSKIKPDDASRDKLDILSAIGLTQALQKIAEAAITRREFKDAEKFYTKLINTYSKIQTANPGQQTTNLEQIKALTLNNIATSALLGNNIGQFCGLKLLGAKLNIDLIKLSGRDIGEILKLEAQLSAQIGFAPSPLSVQELASQVAPQDAAAAVGAAAGLEAKQDELPAMPDQRQDIRFAGDIEHHQDG